MPIAQLVVLFGVALLAVAAMSVALGAAWVAGRRRAETSMGVPLAAGVSSGGFLARADATTAGWAETGATISPVTVDRVVRVVALLFMAAVGVVVAVSREWPDTEVAIYLLLAAGTLFVVSMQDLLPTHASSQGRYWIGAAGALAFLTVLVGLSGGLGSPFFLGFFLLVAGGCLATEGISTVVLALAAGASYAIIGLLVDPDAATDGAALAWIGFDLAALALLAYVATVAGREQRRAREAALRLSRFDPLTGLYNRGAFFAAVEREIRRVERTGRGFCVLMLDLDDLKPVNDTFGHPAGDLLLRSITEVVLRTVRATDTAGRFGGDEFVVLLPETDPDGAFVVAEKLRRDVAALAVRVDQRSIRTSVSIGLVAFPEDGGSMEALLAAVDAAMYEAKRRGKNQIVGYTTRTERIATAIGAEPTTQLRRRTPRTDESRAAQVGVPPRPDGAPWPAAQAAPDDPGDDDAPDPDGPDGPAGPAGGNDPVPADAFLPGGPERSSATPRSSSVDAAWPRIRSMPPPSARPAVVPVPIDIGRAPRPVPSRPRSTAGSRPPVPPVGSGAWQTRGVTPTPVPEPSRDPRKPDGRRYMAYPIDPDDDTPA